MAGTVVVRALLGVSLLVGIAACGGGDEPKAINVTSTTRPPSALNGFADCSFPAGAPATRAGLASVGGSALAVSWDTPADVAAPASAAYEIKLGPRYTIGFKRGGAPDSRYVVDLETNQTTNLTTSFTETAEGISIVVPATAIPKARTPLRWHAEIVNGGHAIARCPAAGSVKFGTKDPADGDYTDPG